MNARMVAEGVMAHALGRNERPMTHAELERAAINERKERNRIARECAEATQERDRLQELVNRLRPLAEAAIAEDIAEEVADQPDAALNHLIAAELEDARKARRAAVADWHLQQLADRAEGRSPLDVAG